MSLPNDPLAGLTTKQLWHDCVWFSNEPPLMKLFLFSVGRYFDAEGGASSISLAQIVRDCGFNPDTARRCAKRARDHWLRVEVQKGFWTRFGRQNLYHAVLPPLVLEGLREYRARQQAMAAARRSKGGADSPSLGGCWEQGVNPSVTPNSAEYQSSKTTYRATGRANSRAASATETDPLAARGMS